MNQVFTIFFFVLICQVVYAKFPSDLPQCKSGDTECLPRVITKILKTLHAGRKDLNLLPISPLHINTIDIVQGNDSPVSVTLNFSDMDLYGITEAVVTKIIGFEKEPKNSKFEVMASIPYLQLTGQYKVNGKILVLPIQGEGKCNVTLDNIDLHLKFSPDVITKNGKDYLQSKNFKFTFETTRLYLNLENLFNGDKALGDNMNLFMNENWMDILNELKPPFTEAFSQIFQSIINNVFNKIAYEEFWLAE